MDKKILGARIRAARKAKKMTQEELAEKADISLTFMGEIERGAKGPSLDVLVNIIEALDVSSDSILRDRLESGKVYAFHDITKKMEKLTPKQVNAISELIDVYIKNL